MWVRNGEEYRERKSKNEDGRGEIGIMKEMVELKVD